MINTGVPTTLAVPQTFHTFTYLYANRSLVSLPMRIALVGIMSASGTAVAGTVYEVADATQTDGLFGIGSELSLMCRMAFACSAFFQKGPRVYACPLAAPGASAARVQTITFTGTATADGNAEIAVAGRPFSIGIRSGDVQNTIAATANSVFLANNENLPVAMTVATNVVTATHRTATVNGQDVKITVGKTVPGVTIAVAQTTAGTGAADTSVAINALAALKYDGIAIGNHAAADITTINTDIAARWSATDKGWRYYFIGEPGTIGTGTALAAAANHQACLIGSFENCPNLAGEIATFMAMATFSRERPNATYNGMRGPLYPPPASDAYTPSECETAIAAGLTPLLPIIDSTGAIVAGQAKIVRMVTTKTTQGANPFYLLRDIGVSRTGIYLARQLDAAYEERFGADAAPDGTGLTDDTLEQIADTAKSIMRACGEARILRNVEADIGKLAKEPDPIALGRVNVDLWYTVVIGLMQVAWKHNVQV